MVSSIDVKAAYAMVDSWGDGGLEWDDSLAAEFDEWLHRNRSSAVSEVNRPTPGGAA